MAHFSLRRGNRPRRYNFRNAFQTIDLGLRLDDARDLELQSGPVSLAANKDKSRDTLRRNGANEDEIDFLVNGQRVELNAMTSNQFLDFVEDKSIATDIGKIVPPKDQLDETYRLFTRGAHVKKIAEEAIAAHVRLRSPFQVTSKLGSATISPKILKRLMMRFGVESERNEGARILARP